MSVLSVYSQFVKFDVFDSKILLFLKLVTPLFPQKESNLQDLGILRIIFSIFNPKFIEFLVY